MLRLICLPSSRLPVCRSVGGQASHRDFLGAILGTGIVREKVGVYVIIQVMSYDYETVCVYVIVVDL